MDSGSIASPLFPSAAPRGAAGIGFIDDVFRHAYWPAKEFFYDLLSVPLVRIFGSPTRPSVRRQMWNDGLLTPPSVDPAASAADSGWAEQFEALSSERKATLKKYVDPSLTYICYEASPGLLAFLEELGITYIDVRVSPVRFLPDILIALRSNSAEINGVLSEISITKREIAREASLLAASFRHFKRYSGGPDTRWRNDSIVFVGQTAIDASIVTEGAYFDIAQIKSGLEENLKGRRIIYLRHPSASEQHIRYQLGILQQCAAELHVSEENGYDLLCSDERLEFLGISSGLLQEAAFFGKTAYSMLPAICPLAFRDEAGSDGYHQLTFQTFVSDELWAALFLSQPSPASDTLRNIRPNELRELHNVWWGYPTHKVRANDYTRALTKEANEVSLRFAKEAHQQIAQLAGTVRFLVDMVAGDPDAVDGSTDEISRRRWRWVRGGIVTFDNDGVVRKDGARSGVWRRLNGRPNAILVMWDAGGWMDFIQYDGDGLLNCTNNLGDGFQVLAA